MTGLQHTTAASEAPCRRCRRPLLYAWDEGRLVRADAPALDAAVVAALRGAGRRVFVLTAGRHLVHETAERVGTLRLAQSRHVEHACPQAPVTGAGAAQLEMFPADSVRPPARRGEAQR